MVDDSHVVHFTWPSTEPASVIVTGTFDQWSSSLHLTKDTGAGGFTGSTRVPWGERVLFKFVVDSQWVCDAAAPTEADASGNVNNVYVAPAKPAALLDTQPVVAPALKSEPEPVGAGPAGAAEDGDAAAAAAAPTTTTTTIADVVDTLTAQEGTSSALGYIASALGAVIETHTGVDPINAAKLPVEENGEVKLPSDEVAPVASAAEEPITTAVPASTPNGPSEHAAPEVTPVIPEPIVTDEAAVRDVKPLAAEPVAGSTPATEPITTAVPASTADSIPETAAAPAAAEPITTAVPASPANGVVTNEPQLTADEPPVPEATQAIPEPTAAPTTTAAPVTATTAPAASSAAPSTPKTGTPSPQATPASTPTTPAKKNHAFPAAGSPSSVSSPSGSGKFGTTASARKKRHSIFGKLKGLFSDKDKEEKK